MTARFSISLSDDAEKRLDRIAQATGAKTSDIIEAALRLLSVQPEAEIKLAIVQSAAAKRVATPAGWRALFWKTLAEALRVDTFVYDSRRPYGPFHFNGCQVVFLLPNMSGVEDGSLTVHIFESVRFDSEMIQPESVTRHYRLEDTVLDAVTEAIEWIASHGESRRK